MWLWTNTCLIAVNWKKNFSISEKLRVIIEKRLLNEEDCKLLLIPKRLFSTHLMSNLPENKEKKEQKLIFFLSGYLHCFMQKFTNFSFSFTVVIGNILPPRVPLQRLWRSWSRSDEEEEPHSKKPQRAMYKMKANEKKDKQPPAWVCDVPAQNKDDSVCDSVFCTFYCPLIPRYVWKGTYLKIMTS